MHTQADQYTGMPKRTCSHTCKSLRTSAQFAVLLGGACRSVMCIVCSGLKMIDFLIWQDDAPYDFPFSGLLLDYALVLRPETLQHKPGQRHPTGRTLAMRIIDALRPLSWAIFQMCGCEALNAVLMQHTRGGLTDGQVHFSICLESYNEMGALTTGKLETSILSVSCVNGSLVVFATTE